jgi:hypothetical protein
VAVYDDDNIKKSKLACHLILSSAGHVCYSPVPAQGSLRLRLESKRGTQMASARSGESTTDDAMAVDIDRKSSGHCDSSDDNGEAADFSLSLHEKEMLEHKYDDDNGDDGAQTESEGPPELDPSSSGDNIQDHQTGSLSFHYSSSQHENREYQALSRNALTSSTEFSLLTGDQSRCA